MSGALIVAGFATMLAARYAVFPWWFDYVHARPWPWWHEHGWIMPVAVIVLGGAMVVVGGLML
jgi:hypothetical protein